MKANINDESFGRELPFCIHANTDRALDNKTMLTTEQRVAYDNVRLVSLLRQKLGKQELALRNTYLMKEAGPDMERDLSDIRAKYRKDRRLYKQACEKLYNNNLERLARSYYFKNYFSTGPSNESVIQRSKLEREFEMTSVEADGIIQHLLQWGAISPRSTTDTYQWTKDCVLSMSDSCEGRQAMWRWVSTFFPKNHISATYFAQQDCIEIKVRSREATLLAEYLDAHSKSKNAAPTYKLAKKLEGEKGNRPYNTGFGIVFAESSAEEDSETFLKRTMNESEPRHFPIFIVAALSDENKKYLNGRAFFNLVKKIRTRAEHLGKSVKNKSPDDDIKWHRILVFTRHF